MNLANGPLVVIPEPIRSMGWSYDVERSILEPHGIRLVVPDTAEQAAEALPEADVVFTSSRLTADDIGRLGSAVRRDPVLQRRDGLRGRRRGEGAGHPDLELPDLEQRGGLATTRCS